MPVQAVRRGGVESDYLHGYSMRMWQKTLLSFIKKEMAIVVNFKLMNNRKIFRTYMTLLSLIYAWQGGNNGKFGCA